MQRQSVVHHQPDRRRGRVGRDRDPRDDGQVLDGRDRQLRVRPQVGRHQRPGLGVPEARQDRVPAVAQIQATGAGRVHATVAAQPVPGAPLLAPDNCVLPGRVSADHRLPDGAQRGPQGLGAAADEGQGGPGVEPELEA